MALAFAFFPNGNKRINDVSMITISRQNTANEAAQIIAVKNNERIIFMLASFWRFQR
jgi:hypothetical protein